MEPRFFDTLFDFVPEAFPDENRMIQQTTFDKPEGCEVDPVGNLMKDGKALSKQGSGKRVQKEPDPAGTQVGLEPLTLKDKQDLLNEWVEYHQQEERTYQQMAEESAGQIVEDAWYLMMDGGEAPPSGVARELQCAECCQGIGALEENFTACILCNKLVHSGKDCTERHMTAHSAEQFFVGLMRRKERQSRAGREANPLPSETPSAGAGSAL